MEERGEIKGTRREGGKMATIVFSHLSLSLLSHSFCLLVLSRRDYPQFSERPSGNAAAAIRRRVEKHLQTLNLRLKRIDSRRRSGETQAGCPSDQSPIQNKCLWQCNIRQIGSAIDRRNARNSIESRSEFLATGEFLGNPPIGWMPKRIWRRRPRPGRDVKGD